MTIPGWTSFPGESHRLSACPATHALAGQAGVLPGIIGEANELPGFGLHFTMSSSENGKNTRGADADGSQWRRLGPAYATQINSLDTAAGLRQALLRDGDGAGELSDCAGRHSNQWLAAMRCVYGDSGWMRAGRGVCRERAVELLDVSHRDVCLRVHLGAGASAQRAEAEEHR